MVVDDKILRIGSSNMNNRSLGLDSECDLLCNTEGDIAAAQPAITALRTRLMAEHLGVSCKVVFKLFESSGLLIETVARLSRPGKTLNLLKFKEPGDIETFIADNEVLDLEHPDAFFEALDNPGLWKKSHQRLGHHSPPAS